MRPRITSYLAEPENAEDFSNGIIQFLEDKELRKRMSQNCRAITIKKYPLELQVKRYIELYSKMVRNYIYNNKITE